LADRHRQTAGALTIVLVVAAHAGQAQDSVRVKPLNFVFTRFASRTSNTLYAGYGVGRGFAFVGLVVNPRTEYREVVAGGGIQVLPGRRNSANVALAAADAVDARYLQLYIVPSLAIWRVLLSGTIELYQPLESAGVRQLGLNPVTATIPLFERIELGATYILFAGAGQRTEQGAGPALRVKIPKGSVTLDLVGGLARFSREARLTVSLGY
jgi:hypothetical protein